MTAIPAPVARVVVDVNGHDVSTDPPAAMSSMRRWTCSRCSRAVLVRPNGTAYGSAYSEVCSGGDHS
ncbi:hypothetical protein EV383_4466 [Pseudonocardia sediminis]|uniref:Uncharacterized protein n=1 Tax=Pseudonocardia sediminis TaxID=1397368 RepID=A0A4Q7V2E2_PSEST|nr:hypothetical protein EV383_4466 [Pseudonocardia sediminis]